MGKTLKNLNLEISDLAWNKVLCCRALVEHFLLLNFEIL